MGLASHLGPWLLGTVKNTTGTTAGTMNNMGVASTAQTKSLTYSDATATQAFVLPRGSLIESFSVITTAAFSSAATITLSLYSDNLATSAITTATTITNLGSVLITAPASPTTAAPLWANVGTHDAIITYTISGTLLTTGTGVLVIDYLVRLADGTYVPSSYTL